jgi:hypothetical protein
MISKTAKVLPNGSRLNCCNENLNKLKTNKCSAEGKMESAKYLLVNVNEDGEHEIIFVTSDHAELMKRYYATKDCIIYTVGDLE